MHGRHFRFPAALLPVLAATLLASCDTGNPTGPRIVSLVRVSGHDQAAPVGSAVSEPLVVRAVDQNGVAVPGVPITWEVVTGGGVFIASSSATDNAGLGQAIFQLGNTLGTQSVSARVGTQPAVTFTFEATTAPASQLRINSGNNQTGTVGATLGAAIVVVVADAVENPKAGVPVTFTVASGGGSLSSTTVVTGTDGLASVTWTLGTAAGAQSVLVTSTGLPSVTFSATANAAAPASMIIVSGNNQVGSPGVTLPQPLRARVLDQFGNGVPGVAVTFTSSPADGTIDPPSSLTGADGIAQGNWTLGPAGGLKVATVAAGALAVEFNAGSTVNYANISVGSHHTCAVSADNVLYCWGFNGDGQLGLGMSAEGSGPVYAVPQPSAVTGALTFRTLSSGGFHTCGVTLSFNPFCWGKNVDGRVGDGELEQVNTPTHVVGTNVFRRISGGGTHTCALTPGDRLHCWGSNAEGQVGVGSGIPTPLDSLAFPGPMPVMPAIPWTDVAAGGLHSCAVRSDGAAFCWGNNAAGQLGTGTFVGTGTPGAVAGGQSFVAITAGDNHTCALTVTGTAWCWGSNTYGQLGNGGGGGSNVPVAVAGGLTFESINAGAHHTCGVLGAPPAAGAEPVGGAVYCWGRNTAGQIGDGSQTHRATPVAASGGLTFQQVSAGVNASCGITLTNLAYCWGDNQYGQLGDGTQTRRLAPTKVAFQP